ncbi:MAG TPA: hypothetical protein VFG91_08770 [Woeseiaceae bacterium]|nr:hypothetical protein [Woeseiaceae bacterium]
MSDRASSEQVVPVQNLRDYFRESMDAAIEKQNVDVDPHAAHYVVNLLTLFSRSEDLYEDHGEAYGLKPLALMLVDAVEAASAEQRTFSLQRIGDVSLFIAGFFADSLAHRLVDLDYYIHMGGNAYGSLSEEIRGTLRGRALAHVYRELAHKFQVVVDVLNEVRDGARRSSDIDLLRTYEVWLKTGSRRAAALLRQNGVVPMPNAVSRNSH